MSTHATQHGINPSVHITHNAHGAIILTFSRWHPKTGTVQQSIELNRRTARRFAKDVITILNATMPPPCPSCRTRTRPPKRIHTTHSG